ncbi:TPA: hypothetical protein ACXEMK_003495 [Enterobacter roggenkampii]
MPQGLQCWDSAGRIVADLSDFSIRYIGSASVIFATGERLKNIPFSGVSQDGSFITIVTQGLDVNEFFCRAFNGGFTAMYLPVNGVPFPRTLNVEIYNFQ